MHRVHLPRVILLTVAAAACVDRPTASNLMEPVLPTPASVHGSSGYTALDLGTLGGAHSSATAINEAGQIVGTSQTAAGEFHAFLWENGIMTDLGTLGGTLSQPFFINENGQVSGISTTASGDRHAFIWERGVGVMDLGTLDGLFSHTLGMNEAGQVVGVSRLPDSGSWFRGFLWESGVMTHIGTLGGPTNTFANDINNAGQITGSSSTHEGDGDFDPHAFVWENGIMLDLGTLGGTSSQARAINDAGQVVGTSRTAANIDSHAFIWEPGEDMISLGTLGGANSGAARINEVGQVVGSSATATSGETHAFLWEEGVGMTDLGTLGGNHVNALALNDGGQVVGNSKTAGTAGNGPFHAFLWQHGVMVDLGTLGGTGDLSGVGSTAADINEAGQIVGSAKTLTEQERATLWRPLTTVERIEDIAASVEELEAAGVLNGGQTNSLTNKLNLATAMLNDGKTTPATNQLEAFINQVQALIDGGVLTSAQGQPLIDAAQAVIDSLNG